MRYIPHYCHVDDGIVFYLKSQILNSSIASTTRVGNWESLETGNLFWKTENLFF